MGERVITYLYEDSEQDTSARTASPASQTAISSTLKGSSVSKWASKPSSPVVSRSSISPAPSSHSSFPLPSRLPSANGGESNNSNSKYATEKEDDGYFKGSRQTSVDSGWATWSGTPSIMRLDSFNNKHDRISAQSEESQPSSEVFVYSSASQEEGQARDNAQAISDVCLMPTPISSLPSATSDASFPAVPEKNQIAASSDQSDAWLVWKPSVPADQEGRQAYERRIQLAHEGTVTSSTAATAGWHIKAATATAGTNGLPPPPSSVVSTCSVQSRVKNGHPFAGSAASKWASQSSSSNSWLATTQSPPATATATLAQPYDPSTSTSSASFVPPAAKSDVHAPSSVVSISQSTISTGSDAHDPWAAWKPSSNGLQGETAYQSRIRQTYHQHSLSANHHLSTTSTSASTSVVNPPRRLSITSNQPSASGISAASSAYQSQQTPPSQPPSMSQTSSRKEGIIGEAVVVEPLVEKDDWANWKAEPAKDTGGLDAFRRRQAMSAGGSMSQTSNSDVGLDFVPPALRGLPIVPELPSVGKASRVRPMAKPSAPPASVTRATAPSSAMTTKSSGMTASDSRQSQPQASSDQSAGNGPVDAWASWTATSQKDQGGAEAFRQRMAMGQGSRMVVSQGRPVPQAAASAPRPAQAVSAISEVSKKAAKRARQRAALELEQAAASRRQAQQQAAKSAQLKQQQATKHVQPQQQHQQQQQLRQKQEHNAQQVNRDSISGAGLAQTWNQVRKLDKQTQHPEKSSDTPPSLSRPTRVEALSIADQVRVASPYGPSSISIEGPLQAAAAQSTRKPVNPSTGFPTGCLLDVIASSSLPQPCDEAETAVEKAYKSLARIDAALTAVRQRLSIQLHDIITLMQSSDTQEGSVTASQTMSSSAFDDSAASSMLEAFASLSVGGYEASSGRARSTSSNGSRRKRADEDQESRDDRRKQTKIDTIGANQDYMPLSPSKASEDQLIDLSFGEKSTEDKKMAQTSELASLEASVSSLLDLEGLEFPVEHPTIVDHVVQPSLLDFDDSATTEGVTVVEDECNVTTRMSVDTNVSNNQGLAVDDELQFTYPGSRTPSSFSSMSSPGSFHSLMDELDDDVVDLPPLAQDARDGSNTPTDSGSPVTPFQALKEYSMVDQQDFVVDESVEGAATGSTYFDMWRGGGGRGTSQSLRIGAFPTDEEDEEIDGLAISEEEEEEEL